MNYKNIPTQELEKMWNEKRLSITGGPGFRKDMDEVFSMKKELDRRKGDIPKGQQVNFEQQYLTD